MMCFVLLSLSPCTVKEALFYTLNADYFKPLNKARATSPVNSCSYAQGENQQLSAAKQSTINKQLEPFYAADDQFYAAKAIKLADDNAQIAAGNSPPKYILYQRLKIDMA